MNNLTPQNKNSVIIADLTMKRVFTLDLDTFPSSSRINYSLTQHNFKMYVFGGLDQKSRTLNSMDVFDVCTYKWETIEGRGRVPSPRQGHATIVVDQYTMYLLGGSGDGSLLETRPIEDAVYKLDIDLNEWMPVSVNGP